MPINVLYINLTVSHVTIQLLRKATVENTGSLIGMSDPSDETVDTDIIFNALLKWGIRGILKR